MLGEKILMLWWFLSHFARSFLWFLVFLLVLLIFHIGRVGRILWYSALLHPRPLGLFSLFFQCGQIDKPIIFFQLQHCLICVKLDFYILSKYFCIVNKSTLLWLMQNKQNQIYSFPDSLFNRIALYIMSDVHLKIFLTVLCHGWEVGHKIERLG